MTFAEPMRWLLNGEWLKLLFEPVQSQVGGAVFAMFAAIAVLVPIYARSGSLAIPSVLLALFAGSLIPLLPGSLVSIAYGVLLAGGAAAILAMIAAVRD